MMSIVVSAEENTSVRICFEKPVVRFELAKSLEQHTLEAFESGARCVIVDLAGVEFIDASGVSLLVRLHQWATRHTKRLEIIHLTTQPREMMTTAGLTSILHMS